MENSVVPSKEMQANQPTNSESGEGHNQPEETRTEHPISISDILEERFRTLMMDSDAPVKEEVKKHKPFIGQVPISLVMETGLKPYFHPRIMSIGPVYHGKKDLEQGQRYKHQLTKLFIEKRWQSKEILYNNILNEIESFKECYDQQKLLDKFNGDDQKLAWMFFVDGCALIQFLRCLVDGNFHDMQIARYQKDLMARDLMLLENQLPLGVLNLVMRFRNEEPPAAERSKEFSQFIVVSIVGIFVETIVGTFREIIENEYVKSVTPDGGTFREIIEIIYKRLEEGVKTDSVADQSFNNHLLELIWMNFVKKEKDGPYYYRTEARNFRSVRDLQAAGIKLEPSHSSSSLRDISFDRGFFSRKLKIPSFVVSEQRKFLLFNLIALEMHPNFTKNLVVTSYISFLNSIIATKEDVAELQKAGILLNYLPNDQEVLDTFRQITSHLEPYPDIFFDTKLAVITHLRNSMRMTAGKWLDEAMQVYFRSPWTTIASTSAAILLFVAIIQTIVSILAYQRGCY